MTDLRESLRACVEVMLHNGVPTDKNHPARVALDAAEAALKREDSADMPTHRVPSELPSGTKREVWEAGLSRCDHSAEAAPITHSVNALEFEIRWKQPEDEQQWCKLVEDYCEDWQHALPVRETFGLANSLVASSPDGELYGLVMYEHHRLPLIGDTIYMAHLYVRSDARRNGIARTFIEKLIAIRDECGANRIYWHTEPDNPARALYDQYAICEFVRYHLDRVPAQVTGTEAAKIIKQWGYAPSQAAPAKPSDLQLIGWWDTTQPGGFRWKSGIVRGDYDNETPIYVGNPAKPADATLTYPAEFTEDLRWILGLICFQCIDYARALRKSGRDNPTKTEDEQAATLEWLLRHYLADPENWRKAAAAEMRSMAAQPATEGDRG